MQLHYENPVLTYELHEMDLDTVSQFILRSYWGKLLNTGQILKSFQNSSCVGLLVAGQQIGFGRAISDSATSAYLKDIIIFGAFQRKGYGRLLMRGLFDHPDLEGVPNWYLGTKVAHGFYESIGFRRSPDGIYMHLRR